MFQTIHNNKDIYAPTDIINGFKVRPGKYLRNGAAIVDDGESFTIHSNGATSCNLCLFKRYEDEPYAIIPFPEKYRIGNTYSTVSITQRKDLYLTRINIYLTRMRAQCQTKVHGERKKAAKSTFTRQEW